MFDFLFGWRKASYCKRLITQVQCRLKLVKNKRCSIVRQSRDDVAQLLKDGHEQSAQLLKKVELIVKDESIVAVYDLLDHFCEFIIINLSYIRSHKDCPNNVNEAVSTLIFASARCGDLPELSKIRKLFGERYGQSFALVALELLPGNLVNRQVMENLSITSVPDHVKYKLVDEIARSCLEPAPLALEYYSELELEQMNKSKGDQVPGRDVQVNCCKSKEHQVHDFSIMEGEGKLVHVDFTSESRNLVIQPCYSHQGSDATTGGSISPVSLPWSVNREDGGRVGNYAHPGSPYESKIPAPSVDKGVGMAIESSSDSSYRLPKEMVGMAMGMAIESSSDSSYRLPKEMVGMAIEFSSDSSYRFPCSSYRLPKEMVGMAIESSSDSSYRLPKKMTRLDDVEEFESTMRKDGNGQDQRLFLFKSPVHFETDRVEDVFDESSVEKCEEWINDKAASRSSRKSRKASGKRQRMRSVSKEGTNVKDVESTMYYGGSLDNSQNENLRYHHRRKHHKRTPPNETRKSLGAQARVGQPCHRVNNGEAGIVHECNLEDPCYFCTSDDKDKCGSRALPKETKKKVGKSGGFGHAPYLLRAMTMPVERSSDCPMVRSNTFAFQQASHIHPKLPDYDELAAKFTALRKANLECKSNQVTSAA
ncbi:uncharacterized protein LOC131329005 isoform X2 [Rhododendron vialii]|uniref:uncharacterized protein LOC131329005 isoform X2 n=1 Tax=Rhododendron vialii TaxID=182163 RepID=UPI00265FEBB0|nr:uncharacterized protein LOC131329005 isoform X2 [Rhododendron vialii]